MHPALNGFLVGLGLSAFLIVIEYIMVKKAVEERAALAPEIALRIGQRKLELSASIAVPEDSTLLVALAAVIEDRSGALSYWALRHAPGKPDFHHPQGFALQIDEVRH